jgi:hypothetical protein
MNDIFQVDYMPDEKKIKINLPADCTTKLQAK